MANKNDRIEERFNRSVLQVVVYAKAASLTADIDRVYLESFIIGILNTGENEVTSILVDMGVDLQKCLRVFKRLLKNKGGVLPSNAHYGNLPADREVMDMCHIANGISEDENRDYIGLEHIFDAILDCSPTIKSVFEEQGINTEECVGCIKNAAYNQDNEHKGLSAAQKALNTAKKRTTKRLRTNNDALTQFCTNMTDLARNHKLDPVIAREKETDLCMTILCRRIKNNPILVGEAGVGKTAVVENLSQRIVSGTVPKTLLGAEVYALNISSLVAGTKYRGQFEERMEALVKAIQSDDKIILFIDEIHTMIGAGSAGEGVLDVSNILKPLLARGELKCIGATTNKDYKKYVNKDGALARRFQKVVINEPDETQTYQILAGLKHKFEEYHSCIITNDALNAMVKWTARYQSDKKFPDKAIDCMDLACAKRIWDTNEKLHRVAVEDVAAVISETAQIPIEIILWDDAKKIEAIEGKLRYRFIGQEQALSVICRGLKNSYSGVKNPDKPILSAVLGGPTGTGKTYLAKELASAVFGRKDAYIRLDMSEFSEAHSVSKLIGSPPGYVGFNEVDVFADKIRRSPYCVILFDEIEKAHSSVVKLLLQVLSEGKMSDALGSEVDFKNTIILITGNFGMNEVKKKLGFGEMENETVLSEETERLVNFFKTSYGAEVVNRIDEFIVFVNFTDDELEKIAKLQLEDFVDRISHRDCSLSFSDDVVKLMVRRSDNEHGMNAKKLERVILKEIEPCLADTLLEIGNNSYDLTISTNNESFVCTKRKKRKTVQAAPVAKKKATKKTVKNIAKQ